MIIRAYIITFNVEIKNLLTAKSTFIFFKNLSSIFDKSFIIRLEINNTITTTAILYAIASRKGEISLRVCIITLGFKFSISSTTDCATSLSDILGKPEFATAVKQIPVPNKLLIK